MTKIFCDIADIKLIKKFDKKRIVKGFTTNPSLMRKAGAKDYSKYLKNILRITDKSLSCEVFADDVTNMISQGNEISKWGKNVYVKVPVTNSKGMFMGEVIKSLNSNNIQLNITAVYNSKQTKQILKNINSIFAGRMADAGKDPIPEIKESIKISKNYKNVEILWASTREPYNYIQAKKLGCQIITVPPNIIEKIEKFGKSFKELTTDTVKGFLVDAKKSKFSL